MVDSIRDMRNEERVRLRREMRARRRSVGPEARRRAASSLAHRLDRIMVYAPARRIAFYLASDGEIDLSLAISRAQQRGARCFVPIIPGRGRRKLRFARIRPETPLRANRFGILEPSVPPRELVNALELDIVILPLVAFDRDGNRLGMGGGYYDATLEIRAACKHYPRPRLVGVAFECQRLERLTLAPWDVPLERIVTEARTYEFQHGSGQWANSGPGRC